MKLVESFVLLCVIASITSPVCAMFVQTETQKVPVTRLLSNLQRKSAATSGKERAFVEWQIGRLLSMAYALKTDEAEQEKNKPESGPFYGSGFGDHVQFNVERATGLDPATRDRAVQNLIEAIRHYREAISLDPNLINAKLGLAWCLDRAGKTQEAVSLYREVFKASYAREANLNGGMRGSSVAMETIRYLVPLLDRKKDAAEIHDLMSKDKELGGIFRAVTPIVVPIAPGVVPNELMVDRTVAFDLDGNGVREYTQWPSAKAGWLVYNDDVSGRIDSGLQLFGQSTWWIFWTDGYQALAALDDNSDGRLSGDELTNLALWQDENNNGRSETGEVKPLHHFAITSLSFDSKRDQEGMLFSSAGVTFEGGATATTYDWLVAPVRPREKSVRHSRH